MSNTVAEAITRAHHEEWSRVVAALARRFGDLDLAEESAAEAFTIAVERWPGDGVPPNPGGWLMTTATRKAIDRIRRESQRQAKHEEAQMLEVPPETGSRVEDDQLRLIFTCCHPALAPEVRLALTLRLVAGLTVPEIAAGLLSSEAAIGQRITRAKAKIRAAHIPFVVPDDLDGRLADVLQVVYLVFNEGYLPSGEPRGLPEEAIRLTHLLRRLLPKPEVTGLLALMLLTEARRASRTDEAGELVTLDEQDRGGWDRALIAEGLALVRECLAINRPGPYQLQAAINAVHCVAADFRDTDWSQLAMLYDQLYAVSPSPVVALNRAVVTAELDGPEVALAAVDRLPLEGYHPFHATRAELLRRLGRSSEARAAYTRAIELAANDGEVRHLTRRRGELVAT